MDMFQIAALVITGCFTALIFKSVKAEYSAILGIAIALLLGIYILFRLSDAVAAIDAVWTRVAGGDTFLKLLLRIVGITYIADLTAGICKDCGYQALAGQVTIAGKIGVLVAGLPIFMNLLDFVLSIGNG